MINTWRKVGMCFILNATIHDLFSSQVQNICGVFLELTMECNETAKNNNNNNNIYLMSNIHSIISQFSGLYITRERVLLLHNNRIIIKTIFIGKYTLK